MTSVAIDALIGLVTNLNKRLAKGKRGKGLQFKLNTKDDNPDWAGTISLRCNRVGNENVSEVIGDIFQATNGDASIIDRIGINKSVAYDKETSERKVLDTTRTVYLTLRPAKDVFEVIVEGLGAQPDYTDPGVLTNVLYEHKFAQAETQADAGD